MREFFGSIMYDEGQSNYFFQSIKDYPAFGPPRLSGVEQTPSKVLHKEL